MTGDTDATRRTLLLGSLLAMAGQGFGGPALAAGVDPSQTIVKLPDQIPWKSVKQMPPTMSEQADLFGSPEAPGPYMVMVRWHPGYMSAPHLYATERLCVVVSGTWFVASGTDFDPQATMPAPAGTFVRRVAQTPHYDGVRRGASEPAVIAIFGIAPVDLHLVDPSKPLWREV